MILKTGSRLKSQVDTTEVIVVRAPAGEVDLRIGGHPPIDINATPEPGLSVDPAAGEAALLGKRYTREAGDLEVLVTKGGEAGLTADGEALTPKETKPLPSSD